MIKVKIICAKKDLKLIVYSLKMALRDNLQVKAHLRTRVKRSEKVTWRFKVMHD